MPHLAIKLLVTTGGNGGVCVKMAVILKLKVWITFEKQTLG